jgi:hypothetical protein
LRRYRDGRSLSPEHWRDVGVGLCAVQLVLVPIERRKGMDRLRPGGPPDTRGFLNDRVDSTGGRGLGASLTKLHGLLRAPRRDPVRGSDLAAAASRERHRCELHPVLAGGTTACCAEALAPDDVRYSFLLVAR